MRKFEQEHYPELTRGMLAKHLGVQGGPLGTFLKWKAVDRNNPNPHRQPGAGSNVYFKAYRLFEVGTESWVWRQ